MAPRHPPCWQMHPWVLGPAVLRGAGVWVGETVGCCSGQVSMCLCVCPCVCEESSWSGCARSCARTRLRQTWLRANQLHANHQNRGAKKSPGWREVCQRGAAELPRKAAPPLRVSPAPLPAASPGTAPGVPSPGTGPGTAPSMPNPAMAPGMAPSTPTHCPGAGLSGATCPGQAVGAVLFHQHPPSWQGRQPWGVLTLLPTHPLATFPRHHIPISVPDGGVTACPPTLQTPDLSPGVIQQLPAP